MHIISFKKYFNHFYLKRYTDINWVNRMKFDENGATSSYAIYVYTFLQSKFCIFYLSLTAEKNK